MPRRKRKDATPPREVMGRGPEELIAEHPSTDTEKLTEDNIVPQPTTESENERNKLTDDEIKRLEEKDKDG